MAQENFGIWSGYSRYFNPSSIDCIIAEILGNRSLVDCHCYPSLSGNTDYPIKGKACDFIKLFEDIFY
jgi:hypothetical protein